MCETRSPSPWRWIILTFIVGCSLSAKEFVFADGPPVQWQKTFGGSSRDYGWSVQQTSDGGYVIAGHTNSFGGGDYDVYLIKTEPNGSSQWEKTFGGSNNDYSFSVQQTSDGGYVIAGHTDSFGVGGLDIYLIKTEPNGTVQWEKTFGGSGGDYSSSVQQTSDGGYVIAGHTVSFGAGDYDVYFIKTEPNGSSEWEKTFGGSESDHGRSVQQTSDSGYVITGWTQSFGDPNGNVYLIKTEPNGSIEWEKTFGGSDRDYGRSVQQTSDGGYVIAGETVSFGAGDYDVYLIKTEPNGTMQWEKTFGGSGGDYGQLMQQTSDGGYVIAGNTNSFGARVRDVYLIKTDPNGNSQWQKTFGGNLNDEGYSVQQTSDGGYIITSRTDSFGVASRDVYLIKLCSEGTLSGDLNCDGIVNAKDLDILISQWLQPRSISITPADIFGVGDGTTDFNDFALIGNQWQTTDPRIPDDMVYIPDGEFLMGDHFSPEGNYDELPVHTVLLDAFFMGKFEITNQQYCDYLNSAYPAQLKVVGGIVYSASDSGNVYPYCDMHIVSTYSQIDFNEVSGTFSVRTKGEPPRDMSYDPMAAVSWYGASAYCNWRSQQEGYHSLYDSSDPNWPCDFSKKGYRLPTEAEWEYAARGGNRNPYYRFPWGDTINHDYANYQANGSAFPYDTSPYTTYTYHPDWNDGIQPYTAPVGSFSPNGHGLYDMIGNVTEWCNDWYASDYYDISPYDNPAGPDTGKWRVPRGGSWRMRTDRCRVARRYYVNPGSWSYGNYGFRLVLDLN